MSNIERDSGNCPTCGQRVGTFTTDEGTSYYLATAEQEASELAFVREQLKVAIRERDHYEQARDRCDARLQQLAGAVTALEDIRDAVRTAAVMSRAAEYAERRAVEALTELKRGGQAA